PRLLPVPALDPGRARGSNHVLALPRGHLLRAPELAARARRLMSRRRAIAQPGGRGRPVGRSSSELPVSAASPRLTPGTVPENAQARAPLPHGVWAQARTTRPLRTLQEPNAMRMS